MEDYKYTPLNLEKPAIRLLNLYPGNGDMTISCELFQAELHQRENMVSYEALSYTWGSPFLPEKIRVNGCYLKITRSLYDTLRDLRFKDRQRVLWIDALCIDQQNDKERGHQVGQMGHIYKEADNVIFRLGLGSVATDLFMENLQWLQKESIQHACGSWSRQDSRWESLWSSFWPLTELYEADPASLQRQGLREILDRPWFRRVWILQEVAFAKAAIISCGKKSVSARLFGLTPLLLGITPDAHCQSVLDIMPSPWRKSTWWSESRSFYKLLLNFGGSEATDPRDLVYALRGMSSDLANKCDDLLFPDYKKSQEKLVHDVTQYIYGFDVIQFELVPHLSSMRALVEYLPRLETNIVRHLVEMSQPEYMETILKRPEILISQNMIKAAAQYDKDGKMVNVLLRCRRGELNIDEEVLVCAAANQNVPTTVFETLRCHQSQPISTHRIFIAAAKNSDSGPSAMKFLLSLEKQDYRITSILEAVAKNTSESSRAEIITILLQQKGNDDNIILDVITAVVGITDCDIQTQIIRRLLVLERNSTDIISEVLTAVTKMQSYRAKTEIIKILLQQKSDILLQQKSNILLQQKGNILLQQKSDIPLQQKGNSTDIISEVLTATSIIQDQYIKAETIRILLEQKGNSTDIISEVLTATANIQDYRARAGIISILLETKGNSNDTISKVLTVAADIQPFGPKIIQDFVRKNPDFEISRDAVSIAIGNWWNGMDNLEVLHRCFPSLLS